MTSVREKLIEELDQTPDFVIQEVLDFLLFIKVRLKHRIREDQTADLQQAPSLPPFLQFVEEISAQIPKEEWEKLPKDLSKNLEHYLYGSPRDEE
ncbi:hypothetical protein [Allocoleopsis franciscana]|uniref:DUF2281 domain-containing protein n=1 Tax=Allocoleopsis franciscana PCC 7113 TaxID=1173027 RepID=K9WDY6_9CYAN|nr:hypothetical protein [Allocoleopsis franciscana]AFZ18453.1 hypothetical protein Mic7113_2666 [Allocoleopsis franciscana PCC 7113]